MTTDLTSAERTCRTREAETVTIRRDDLELLLNVCACYAPYPRTDEIREVTDRTGAALRNPDTAETCKHCSKPIEPCKVRRSHVGCSSGHGYIHRDGGHTCEHRSDGPYAQPVSMEPAQ